MYPMNTAVYGVYSVLCDLVSLPTLCCSTRSLDVLIAVPSLLSTCIVQAEFSPYSLSFVDFLSRSVCRTYPFLSLARFVRKAFSALWRLLRVPGNLVSPLCSISSSSPRKKIRRLGILSASTASKNQSPTKGTSREQDERLLSRERSLS